MSNLACKDCRAHTGLKVSIKENTKDIDAINYKLNVVLVILVSNLLVLLVNLLSKTL